MATGYAGLIKKHRSALADTLTSPASGSVMSDSAIESRIGGGKTTRRRTAAEDKAIADFDKNVLPGLSEHQPRYINNMPDSKAVRASADARLKADPYDLDYAENQSGKFGSEQRVPGQTSAPAAQPEVRRAIPVGPVSRTDGLAAQAGLGGGASGSALAQATRPAGVAPSLPAPTPAPASPVSSIPTPSGPPAPTGLATPTYNPTVGETPSLPSTTPYRAGGEPEALPSAPAVAAAPAPTPSGTPAAQPTPGRATEAGVSNSQAAGFTQPTKQNPVPQTPTTPTMDVNDFDKKKQFAGF